MKVALTINCDRFMAPVFAGVEVWISDSDAEAGEGSRMISTRGWHQLAWGAELKRLGVDVLICGGVDMATYSALEGHGIQVIPDASGSAPEVFNAWRCGRLVPPEEWPPNPADYVVFMGRAGRGRGGFSRGGGGRGHRRGRGSR